MQEHNENKSEQQQAKDAEKIAIPKHQVGEKSEPNQAARRAESDDHWQKRFSIYSLVFDGIVAISAIIGGYLIWEQLELTRESNKLTVAALVQAKEQFDSQRKDAVKAGNEERERFFKALGQQQEDAAADRELARQSLAQTKKSLVVSERAWLSIISVNAVNNTMAPGEPFRVEGWITNVGKSPALDARPRQRLILGPFGNEGPPLTMLEGAPIVGRMSTVVIGSGQGFKIRTASFTINSGQWELMKKGDIAVFLIGDVNYRDILNGEDKTTFCHVYLLEDQTWSSCASGNAMK